MGDVIFVEGVPGTGKSTTAQFLARQLTHHGRAARWVYEEEVPNPRRAGDTPPVPSLTALAPLTGRYRDGDREVSVAIESGQLVLRGVLWPANALLPVAATVFDVEAWPFRVSFDEHGLSWSGPRLWWGGRAGTFQRVAT